MTGTRFRLFLGLAAVVLAVVLGSSSSSADRPPWWDRNPPTTITYVVAEPCILRNNTGEQIETIGLRRQKTIRWVNRTQNPVAIFFEPPIVGRDHIYLRPGESYVTTITRMPPNVEETKITVMCLDPETGTMSLVPPEPIECPPDTTKPCP
jgi:hypothetical protein